MSKLFKDLSHTIRLHLRALGFTLAALSTLALGIGASTVVFSAVNTVLLKQLPYPEPQRIVIPWRLAPKNANIGYNEIPWGPMHFRNFERMKSFESIAAFKGGSFNLTGAGEPVQVEGVRVSSGFFRALGVTPLRGRTFSVEEDRPGHEREAILSYQLWQGRFHGEDGILGRSLDLSGVSYRVVGVMRPGFDFPRNEEMPGSFDFPHRAQLWIPLALPAASQPDEPDDLAVIGRLKPAVTVARAQAEMDWFTGAIDRTLPESKGWFNSRVTGLTEQVVGDTRKPLMLIMAAVGVLLLIACVNVANLYLTRALGRRSEFAVRAALGGARSSLLRQLLTESTVLSLFGGAAGLAIAELGIHLVKVFGPSGISRLQELTLDWRVLAFTFGTSLLCGAVFGLAPAASLLSADLAGSLREYGRGGTGNSATARLRGSFLVIEIALAFVLIIASGLLVRTFFRLLAVDPGFHAERVLTFELSLPNTKYTDTDQIAAFYGKVLRELRAIPAVAHAGIVETIPIAGAADGTLIRLPGSSPGQGKRPFANYNIVSPGYFSAVGTPLLSGRAFLDSDGPSSTPVVIISSAMARKFFPNENPIGKQVGLADPRYPAMNIIGVAADVKHLSLREESGPEMYVPFTQRPFPSMLVMHVVLRARLDAVQLTGSARDAIHRLDPDLPVTNVATLRTLFDKSLANQRFATYLIGFFGLASLVLASIGLYGVISYSVLQRTREIGVRMALGAKRVSLIAMVLGQGARLIAVGIVIGVAAALAVTRLMENVLYGVLPTDLLTFAVVIPILTGVSLVACCAPAYRASRVDPLVALRHE